jgi:hypothetical protein
MRPRVLGAGPSSDSFSFIILQIRSLRSLGAKQRTSYETVDIHTQ